jgi:putative transposase
MHWHLIWSAAAIAAALTSCKFHLHGRSCSFCQGKRKLELAHSKMNKATYRTWHHSPSHLLVPGSAYIVTGGTYKRLHIFEGPERLELLQSALFEAAERSRWQLEAWCALPNHYHFVASAPDDADSLKRMIQLLHSWTARVVNGRDGAPGRRVWFQYWDTCLTHERSYLARLNYVHTNAVKHGTVGRAEDYPYCSATWFAAKADPAFYKLVTSLRTDRIDVVDDF